MMIIKFLVKLVAKVLVLPMILFLGFIILKEIRYVRVFQKRN